MKPVAFDYACAEDSAQAVALLAGAPGEARPIAGGQSLGPMLNLRLARPRLLVDVRRCADLRGYVDEGDAIVYGAAITHAEIEDARVPDATGGWLAHAARRIAYRAVRNRGTLGGSLAHADPAADWLAVMLALGAEVVIRGPAGSRAAALADVITGPFATALAADEILVGVRVRKRDRDFRLGYRKLAVKEGEFARALAVVIEDPARGETRAVAGAIERVPVVVEPAVELIADPARAVELIDAHLPRLDRAMRHLHATTLRRATEGLAGAAEAA